MGRFIDLTNRSFGKLTVLKRGSNRGKHLYWLCRCECGIEKEVNGASLRNGDISSCGARKCAGRMVDLTGKVFGKLAVIKRTEDIPKSRQSVWLCMCECGVEVKKEAGLLKEGVYSTCGRCDKKEYVEEIREAYWKDIKVGAEKRNIPFEVSREYVQGLFTGKCSLSGVPISLIFKWRKQKQTASLDRIDSSKGYIAGNLQWVHKTVNKMKNNIPDKEFKEWCRLIYVEDQKNEDGKANE